jgi:serine/threonine protein kinase
LDSEGNIRLGDFGLATQRHEKPDIQIDETEVSAIYDAIEDISELLGGSAQSASVSQQSTAGESMTGGVGTAFYRAPEQEGTRSKSKSLRGDSSYNVQVDVYSLGIILFEMFHPPFSTVRISWFNMPLYFICVRFVNCHHLGHSVYGKVGDTEQIARRWSWL